MSDELKTTAEKLEVNMQEFWKVYDDIVHSNFLNQPWSGAGTARTLFQDSLRRMQEMTKILHESRSIHDLKNPDRGWHTIYGWLALRDVQIMREDGGLWKAIRSGDVIIQQIAWDRDVPITHMPIEGHIVSGYLLSGRQEDMVGMFMPLYSRAMIEKCVWARLKRNEEEAMSWLLEERIRARWPAT